MYNQYWGEGNVKKNNKYYNDMYNDCDNSGVQ